MKTYLIPLTAAFALGGCVSPYGWSEAPLANPYHATGAPVSWWGRDVASADVFYGALSGYGNWANHSRYGRVFLPGGVATGWQPYSQGYWRDDPRRGRMWVSSEPWGFATYHYGRWGRDSRLGWFWVPDTRFGPGWVDWQSSGGYASWAPIPPYGWSNSGYGYGNDWWVSSPGYWAYRPGNSGYLRPGRHDRYDRYNPGQRPPGHTPGQTRAQGDAVIGNYIRDRVNQNPQRGQGSQPDQSQQARPPRGMPPSRGVAPPERPAPPRAGPARPDNAERAQPPRAEVPRGNPRSGTRETRGREISPRTVDD